MSQPLPTQSRYPWRATLRTAFAFVVGLAAAWGLIVEAAGVDQTVPIIASSLAAASAVTRVMALPAVNDLIEKFLPFLAPAPKPSGEDPETGLDDGFGADDAPQNW